MIKVHTFLFRVLVVATLPIFVYSTQTVLSQSKILNIVSDGLIAPIGDHVTYYDFTVPEDASNPRLIGNYKVISHQDIDVIVVDHEGCTMYSGSCVSVYQAPNRYSGDVDVSLTPGRTYSLGFHNPDYHAGERTTQVDFEVQYD